MNWIKCIYVGSWTWVARYYNYCMHGWLLNLLPRWERLLEHGKCKIQKLHYQLVCQAYTWKMSGKVYQERYFFLGKNKKMLCPTVITHNVIAFFTSFRSSRLVSVGCQVPMISLRDCRVALLFCIALLIPTYRFQITRSSHFHDSFYKFDPIFYVRTPSHICNSSFECRGQTSKISISTNKTV